MENYFRLTKPSSKVKSLYVTVNVGINTMEKQSRIATGAPLFVQYTRRRWYPIEFIINADTKFNTSTNGKPQRRQYDFMQVCAHEIIHGMFHGVGKFKLNKDSIEAEYSVLKPNHRYLDFVAFETTDGQLCSLSSLQFEKKNLAMALQSEDYIWFASSKGKIAQLDARKTSGKSSVSHIPQGASYGSVLKPQLIRGEAYQWSPVIAKMAEAMMDRSDNGVRKCSLSVIPKQKPEKKKRIFNFASLGDCRIC